MFSFIKNLFGPSTNLKQVVADGAVIIDVRSKSEYESGHLQGSKNIPLDKISSQVAQIKKMNKPVITVCRSGARSGMAKSILQKAGVQVYNGGAWFTLKNKIS